MKFIRGKQFKGQDFICELSIIGIVSVNQNKTITFESCTPSNRAAFYIECYVDRLDKQIDKLEVELHQKEITVEDIVDAHPWITIIRQDNLDYIVPVIYCISDGDSWWPTVQNNYIIPDKEKEYDQDEYHSFIGHGHRYHYNERHYGYEDFKCSLPSIVASKCNYTLGKLDRRKIRDEIRKFLSSANY